jgi:hypothetical protein
MFQSAEQDDTSRGAARGKSLAGCGVETCRFLF